MENQYQFEICTNSATSCLAAQEGGADRVELCAGIPEGGTTPSYGEIITARKLLNIKLHVIIRPRGGDFLYSDIEKGSMLEDIRMARSAKVDGVVFGCLTSEGDIDTAIMKELMEASEGLPVTFHRAFDVCRNPRQALEDIIKLGCNRILTSGHHATAEEGVQLLKQLHAQAGGRIILMAGCGVNEGNIASIARETGIQEFHFSAREKLTSGMLYKNESVSMGGIVRIDEYEREVTSARRVSETIEQLSRKKIY